MLDHTAFLKTICANPNDMGPRLVYADWLEEQGDLRGEYIRLAIADKDHERQAELLESGVPFPHREWDWLNSGASGVSRYLSNGFVERVDTSFEVFRAVQSNMFKTWPVRHVYFRDEVRIQRAKIFVAPTPRFRYPPEEIICKGPLLEVEGYRLHDLPWTARSVEEISKRIRSEHERAVVDNPHNIAGALLTMNWPQVQFHAARLEAFDAFNTVHLQLDSYGVEATLDLVSGDRTSCGFRLIYASRRDAIQHEIHNHGKWLDAARVDYFDLCSSDSFVIRRRSNRHEVLRIPAATIFEAIRGHAAITVRSYRDQGITRIIEDTDEEIARAMALRGVQQVAYGLTRP